MSEFRPFNQETDPEFNMEPGLVLTPGSKEVREYARFEQFPSKYTVGTQPGNPWVYRPFPKMVYRAERYPGSGKLCCMAAPPDPSEFDDPKKAEHAQVMAQRFTDKCQLIVRDEVEYSRAMESGYRDSAAEAVAHAEARENRIATATAERLYEDRNMSERARREAEEVVAASGGQHEPEITGRKVKEAREDRRSRRSA
jgi:hypothetical protein